MEDLHLWSQGCIYFLSTTLIAYFKKYKNRAEYFTMINNTIHSLTWHVMQYEHIHCRLTVCSFRMPYNTT
jgi:hypothetical protein